MHHCSPRLGGADYIETLDKDKDEFLKNDMCVSRAGKGLTHAKDKKTGKIVFRDAKNRIIRNVYGKSPEWWNAVNNRVIATGLGEHFGTGLAGVKPDLEHWGDDKALARDDAVSYWFAEVMRAQNAILATIENLVIADKQKGNLQDPKLEEGLKDAIEKWEKHLDKLVKEMQENAPEQLASLSGHLIRQKGAGTYKDDLIDKVTAVGRKSQAFALAHDIAMRYAADKFTNGEVVRYFPRGDRDVQGWAYGLKSARVSLSRCPTGRKIWSGFNTGERQCTSDDTTFRKCISWATLTEQIQPSMEFWQGSITRVVSIPSTKSALETVPSKWTLRWRRHGQRFVHGQQFWHPCEHMEPFATCVLQKEHVENILGRNGKHGRH